MRPFGQEREKGREREERVVCEVGQEDEKKFRFFSKKRSMSSFQLGRVLCRWTGAARSSQLGAAAAFRGAARSLVTESNAGLRTCTVPVLSLGREGARCE